MNKAIITLLSKAISDQALNSSYPNKCPDKIFGTYDANARIGSKFKHEERDIGLNGHEYAIILVLESPNKDEFDSNKQGIGPAQGKTGKNIKTYLEEIFESYSYLLKNKIYDIVLINAIQLQCSLGIDTLLYRDAMFLYHWEQEKYRIDFRERFEKILKNYSKGGIIINCCTKGKHNDFLTYHVGSVCKKYLNEIGFDYSYNVATLQGMVEKEIKKSISEEKNWKNFVSTHPASWNRNKRNRRIKKKLK